MLEHQGVAGVRSKWPIASRLIVVVLLGVFACFFAVPMIWLLIAATKTYNELQTTLPLSVGSWNSLVSNWNQLMGFESGAFVGWVGNSALYSIGALALTLLVTIPAGYALALSRFRMRRPLLGVTLIVMMIPNTALVLPIFLELSSVRLISSPLAVILPFSFFPFGVYLTYIHFSTSVPTELLAAARIDGCTEFQLFTRIAAPLALPVIGLVAFLSFVQDWTNYFLPYFVLQSSDAYPIQIGLSLGGAPAIPLALVITTLPVALFFVVVQRFVSSGQTLGALAGE